MCGFQDWSWAFKKEVSENRTSLHSVRKPRSIIKLGIAITKSAQLSLIEQGVNWTRRREGAGAGLIQWTKDGRELFSIGQLIKTDSITDVCLLAHSYDVYNDTIIRCIPLRLGAGTFVILNIYIPWIPLIMPAIRNSYRRHEQQYNLWTELYA